MRDAKESEVRRLEIMNAAMQLFMEKGYTNTTTQDIVDKVNISRGLLTITLKIKKISYIVLSNSIRRNY